MRVLAVDGPSGSGKTTLAAALAAEIAAPVVAMDDLYPGWAGLAEGVRRLASGVLLPLSRGLPGHYRRWDWASSRAAETVLVEVPAGGVLIVEGCGSSVGAAGSFAAVRVWVEAPEPVRRARGLARDGASFAPHWEAWRAQEAALFGADRTRARADLVLRTGGTAGQASGQDAAGAPGSGSSPRPAGGSPAGG